MVPRITRVGNEARCSSPLMPIFRRSGRSAPRTGFRLSSHSDKVRFPVDQDLRGGVRDEEGQATLARRIRQRDRSSAFTRTESLPPGAASYLLDGRVQSYPSSQSPGRRECNDQPSGGLARS